jgi:hypothetical protein
LAESSLCRIRQAIGESSVVVDSIRHPEELAVLRREFLAVLLDRRVCFP